jgi:hypothetical protein
MFDETKKPPSANDLLQHSLRHCEFQAEPAEHLKHKQIESEKIARDIGFQRALTDWIIKHRAKWCNARQPETQQNRIQWPDQQ